MTKVYDERHGGPYDRGSADAYYRRDFNAHCYLPETGQRITLAEGTPEYEAYEAGYQYQVLCGDFKDWGD